MSKFLKYQTSSKVLVAIGLILSACTPKSNDTRKRIDDADIVRLDLSQRVDKNLSQEAARLENLILSTAPFLDLESKKSSELIDTESLFTQVITPVGKVVLDPAYVYNPDYLALESVDKGGYLIRSLIEIYTRALYLAQTGNPKRVKSSGLLERFYEVIMADCGPGGRCRLVSYLDRFESVYTIEILKALYNQTDKGNFQKRRSIIRLGAEIANNSGDSNLTLMMVDNLISSINLIEEGKLDRGDLKADSELFSNALMLIDPQEINIGSDYIETLEKVGCWSLSKTEHTPFSAASQSLIYLCAQAMMYNTKSSDRFTADFQSALDAMDYVVKKDYELGVDFILANLQGQWKGLLDSSKTEDEDSSRRPRAVSPQMVGSLKTLVTGNSEIEVYEDHTDGIYKNFVENEGLSFTKDEYFFLAHKLFHKHYEGPEALAFWENTERDADRLLKAFDNLLKIQIVNAIVLTNTKMVQFYENNSTLSILKLLEESDTEASKVRLAWDKIHRSAEELRVFAERVVSSPDAESMKQMTNFTKNVEALQKNVKFYVTYPNMFPLLHVIASQGLNDSVQSFFATITIDSDVVIDSFFSGTFQPWFNFGHDEHGLDTVEIVYSFYYALATSIFDAFRSSTVVKFSPENFLKVVGKQLIKTTEEALVRSLDNLSKTRNQNRNARRELIRACNEERKIRPTEDLSFPLDLEADLDESAVEVALAWGNHINENMVSRTTFRSNLSFENIGNKFYAPTSSDKNTIGGFINSANDSDTGQNLKSIKQRFEKSVFLTETLYELYLIHNPEQAESIFDEYSSQFADFNRVRATYLAAVKHDISSVDNCEWDFLRREKDIKVALAFREARFLSDLFEAIWNIREDLEKASAQNLNWNDQFLGCTSAPQTDENADESPAVASSEGNCSSPDTHPTVQKIQRIRGSGLFGFTQNPELPKEYRDERSFIKITPNQIQFRKMDAYARTAYRLENTFPGEFDISYPLNFQDNSIYTDNSVVALKFDFSSVNKAEAKNNFVRDGMGIYQQFIPWVAPSSENKMLDEKQSIVVQLFKLGATPTVFHDDNPRLNQEIDALCRDYSPESATDETKIRFEQNCIKITATEVLDFFKNMIEYKRIDDSDRVLLNILGRPSKSPDAEYENLVKVKNEKAMHYQYDLAFKLIFSDGSANSAFELWFRDDLHKYVASAQARENSQFIFAYSDKVQDVFMKRYASWLDQYFRANREFLQEIRKVISGGSTGYFVGDYAYRSDTALPLGVNDSEGTLSPLISPLMYRKFIGYIADLDETTSRYFSNSPLLQKMGQSLSQYRAEMEVLIGEPISDEHLQEAMNAINLERIEAEEAAAEAAENEDEVNTSDDSSAPVTDDDSNGAESAGESSSADTEASGEETPGSQTELGE